MRLMHAFSIPALTLVLVVAIAAGSGYDSGGSSSSGWGTVDAGLTERIKGDDLLKQGRYEEALSAYEKATDYDPYSSAPWRGKCKALLALDRPNESVEACQRALELDPRDTATRDLLSDAISAASGLPTGVGITPLPMTVSIDSTSAGARSTATIPVKVTGASNLARMEFIVTYDPSVLKFSNGNIGEVAPNGMVSFTNQDAGSVKVALADPDGISGNGTLVKLVFDVVGSKGAISTMNVNVIGAWTKDLTDVRTTTQAGTVTVKAPVSAVTVLLGVLGAGLLVMFRRSRDR